MKTLMLMRHAKSSWAESGVPDHERPLNRRGKRDAPRMGRLLLESGLLPDWIVSSTAQRARSTAQFVAEACGFASDIVLSADLYVADVGDFFKVIQKTPEHAKRLLVVSHNPGIEYFVRHLAGAEAVVPTAAVACFRLDCADWRAAGPRSTGELLHLWRPKEVGDESSP